MRLDRMIRKVLDIKTGVGAILAPIGVLSCQGMLDGVMLEQSTFGPEDISTTRLFTLVGLAAF
jgi:hypothetical protein